MTSLKLTCAAFFAPHFSPFKQHFHMPIVMTAEISPQDINVIFSNIPVLVTLHKEFVEGLEGDLVAESFLKMV